MTVIGSRPKALAIQLQVLASGSPMRQGKLCAAVNQIDAASMTVTKDPEPSFWVLFQQPPSRTLCECRHPTAFRSCRSACRQWVGGKSSAWRVVVQSSSE